MSRLVSNMMRMAFLDTGIFFSMHLSFPRPIFNARKTPEHRGEADDLDSSPNSVEAESPRENSSSNTRRRPSRRYEPYGGDSASSSKSQRRPRSHTRNSTSEVGAQSQGDSSREGDSPLTSPATPSLSAGSFDPNTFIGYRNQGIPGFPGPTTNYYPLTGFYPNGHPPQTIPFPTFSYPVNGGGNSSSTGENTHPSSGYPSAPALYTPSHPVFPSNVASTAVHFPAAAVMHCYPTAVGTWRAIPAPPNKEDDDQQEANDGQGPSASN